MQSVLLVVVTTLSSYHEQQQQQKPSHKPSALLQSLITTSQVNLTQHPSIHPSTHLPTICPALPDLLARLPSIRLGTTFMLLDLSDHAPTGDPTSGQITITPAVKVTGAGPMVLRPSIPRSISAIEPTMCVHLGLPAGAALRGRPSTHIDAARPPFLMRHARTKSAEPSLAYISPSPASVSRPQTGFAEALLHRALEEDCDAREWADDVPQELPQDSYLPIHYPHQLPPLPNPPNPVCQMDPLLAELEAKSRLNVQTECAICQKKGINFPKCPKCQLEFCSRACRVSMGDGERHKCA